MERVSVVVAGASMVLLLAACGGGSGGDSSSVDTERKAVTDSLVQVFIDAGATPDQANCTIGNLEGVSTADLKAIAAALPTNEAGIVSDSATQAFEEAIAKCQ